MVGNPLASIVWGAGGAALTPEEIAQARALQLRKQLQGVDTSPVDHWTQGAARVADAISGAFQRGSLDKAAAANDAYDASNYGSLGDALAGGAAYPASVAAGGSPTADAAVGLSGPSAYRDAIASIESAGSGDYAAVGPTHPKMGPALGRYQIMEANLGPWGQEAIGRPVSKDEFLANPKIQDALFDHKFGGYVKQFGPAGAAQAWFAGPGGVGKTDRKDSLGTSVGVYGDKFLTALNRIQPQAPAAAAINAIAPVQTASLDPSVGMGSVPPIDPRLGDDVGGTPVIPPTPEQQQALNQNIQASNPNGINAAMPAGQSGEIRQGPDGQSYQYAETTGMAGSTGSQGWIPVNAGQPMAQPPAQDVTQVPALSSAADVPFAQPNPLAAAVAPQPAAPTVQRVAQALPIRAMADPADTMVAGPDQTLQPDMAPQAQAPQRAGPDTALLVRAMTDPRASDRTRKIASLVYEKQQAASTLAQKEAADKAQFLFQEEYKKADPKYQQDLTKGDLEIEKLKNPTTQDITEYNYAKSPQGGGFTGTFPEWVIANKKAGASNQNVSVGGELQQDKTIGEGLGKDLITMIGEEKTARSTISSLNAMEKEMSDPNFYSGAGAQTVANLKRFAATLGIDPESVSSTEAFNALSKKAVLDNMGGSLGTGVSNADRDYIEGQVPTISNTAPGNKKIIDITRKINERKVKVAGLARTYAQAHGGRLDLNFYDELGGWADKNPLFSAEERKATEAPATQQGGSNELHFDANGNLIQ